MVYESLGHKRLQLLAYWFWQKRGSPIGSPEEDWCQAEALLGPDLPLPPEARPSAFSLEPYEGGSI